MFWKRKPKVENKEQTTFLNFYYNDVQNSLDIKYGYKNTDQLVSMASVLLSSDGIKILLKLAYENGHLDLSEAIFKYIKSIEESKMAPLIKPSQVFKGVNNEG